MPVPLEYIMYKTLHPVLNELELREVAFTAAATATLLVAPVGHVLAIKVLRIYNSSTASIASVELRDVYVAGTATIVDTVMRIDVGPRETVVLNRDDVPRRFNALVLVSNLAGVYVEGTLEVY